jgi:hypothetical protein
MNPGNQWQTSVPAQFSGNGFLSGLAVVTPYAIPGGATVTWTAALTSDTPNLSVNWQFSAAVYSQFGTNGAIQAKACDDSRFSGSSDPAGTPEAYKQYCIGGGGGGGGFNYTGGRSSPSLCSPGFDRCLDIVSCPAPSDVCHVQGVCQPSTGTCTTPAAPNGTSCSTPNATATCQGGSCTLAACNPSYADCNGDCNQTPSSGCETATNTVSNCNGCGITCKAGPNPSATCTAAGCGLACQAGYANCDGNTSNGCETSTSSNLYDCGACGNVCAAGARCAHGACVDQLPGANDGNYTDYMGHMIDINTGAATDWQGNPSQISAPIYIITTDNTLVSPNDLNVQIDPINLLPIPDSCQSTIVPTPPYYSVTHAGPSQL